MAAAAFAKLDAAVGDVPDMPSGWPAHGAAIRGRVRVSAMPSWRSTAMPREAKASLSSTISTVARRQGGASFCVSRAGRVRGATGGGTAEDVGDRRQAMFWLRASEAMRAAALSLTPDALPAVTVPPCRNGVGSFASARSWCPRGCSSSTTTASRAADRYRVFLARRPLAER